MKIIFKKKKKNENSHGQPDHGPLGRNKNFGFNT